MDKTLTSGGKILYQSANVAEFFWRQNTIDFASVRHRIHLKFKVSWKFQFLFLWAGIKPLKFNFMADCTFYNLIPWKARRMSTRIGSNCTNLNSFLRPYCKKLRELRVLKECFLHREYLLTIIYAANRQRKQTLMDFIFCAKTRWRFRFISSTMAAPFFSLTDNPKELYSWKPKIVKRQN